MRLNGWIFMMLSWTFILSLAVFCFSRIFKKGLGGGEEELQGTQKEEKA